MCGIAGFVDSRSIYNHTQKLRVSLKEMLDIQAYRGPDGEGEWIRCLDNTWIALGHRRLSIIDLSDAANQPMVSTCGQYVLVYNGEVYNYLELRKELQNKGYLFHTNSDTEVVLQKLIECGEKAFESFNGMWSLALLDKKKRCLILSRDRFGEKPLYYYTKDNNIFYFASEIKAICKASKEKFYSNGKIVARFLGQSQINAQNETFFKGIMQVPAASYIVLTISDNCSVKMNAPKFYWHYPKTEANSFNNFELVEKLRENFIDSVRIRLRSDVPLGVLLSGGVDSSAIASAMYHINPDRQLNILSVISDDADYDEQPFIDIMANYLHQPVYKVKIKPDPKEAFRLLKEAIWFNDQPIGGFSAAAHMMLMKKAQEQKITVLLSGQGGDELLCGYLKYYGFYLQDLIRSRDFYKLGKVTIDILSNPSSNLFSDFKLSDAKRYLPSYLQPRVDRIFGEALRDENWLIDIGLGNGLLQDRQALDMQRFSVPSLTHYEDRMSMAFSREIRLPFLDHRLAELLLPLEPGLKLRKGWTKWIFRKAMTDMLPPRIAWRRDKKGFSNPEGKWLKREWRQDIEDILDGRMKSEELGLINKSELKKLYFKYCQSKNPWLSEKDIFNPLSLEIWARLYQNYLS